LGVPKEDLEVVILEDSGHEMWRLQMKEFVGEVSAFVETYK